MAKHRWGNETRFEHKTERECSRCRVVMVTRHEWEGGREKIWNEFWMGLERVDDGSGARPVCEPVEQMA